MTKEKFFTGKKADFLKAQEEFSDFGIQQIKKWTNKELKKYRTEPVVIPYNDYGFFVGRFIVQGIEKNCWDVTQFDGTLVGQFLDKKTAILYSLFLMTNRYSRAEQLLDTDTKLARFKQDLQFYEKSIEGAKKRGDKVKLNILLNRYIDTKMKCRTYSNILKKSLNSAKYINFGNKPL